MRQYVPHHDGAIVRSRATRGGWRRSSPRGSPRPGPFPIRDAMRSVQTLSTAHWHPPPGLMSEKVWYVDFYAFRVQYCARELCVMPCEARS